MKASRALCDVYAPFTAKNTAGVTPLISHFAGMDYGSSFKGIWRSDTAMICSNDAFKELKKRFSGERRDVP